VTAGELLGAEGPFARRLAGFQPRAVQQTMATAVEQALEQRSALVVEAGTGTGKTYAYLVPALRSGRRVVVSTGTKNLQDQLFFRDLPKVREALAAPAKVSLLKGRANYLCLYRLRRAQSDPRSRARRQVLQTVDEWSRRTQTGEVAELGAIGGGSPATDEGLLYLVTSNADNCLGAKCPDFAACHVVKARRAAQGADLVVVNHHLLFADFRLKQEGFGVLPGADAVIVDEAHQLPELAAQFFGERVSTRQLLDLMRDAGNEEQVFRDMPGLVEAIDALAHGVGLLERVFAESGGGRQGFAEFGARPGSAAALAAAGGALAAVREELRRHAERSAGLENCAARAALLATRLEQMTADAEPGIVRWAEAQGRGGALHRAPVEPAEDFRRLMAAYPGAWVFTSATLAAGDDFSGFRTAMGLGGAPALRLDSPFDYAAQARLFIPPGLPDPNEPEYIDAVTAALLPLIAASGGGAFILCTSHRALVRIAAGLRGAAAALGLPVLVQGEDSKAALVERFARSGNAVLVATSSFWEGVDVKGHALRLVAIDRLPFGQQNDPVLEARLDAVKARGGSAFFEIQLPRAITALRQGVGRLIRDPADRGLIVICDPRLRSKAYGRKVLASLPPMQALKDQPSACAWLRAVPAAAANCA
jgi:ATP-dependent DNA helicase DinG